MTSQSVILIFVIALSLWGCEPALKVTSDYDKTANFVGYKTFKLNTSNDEAHQSISPLNKDRVYNAVRAEMLKRNFMESNQQPDLIVHTVSIFKDKYDRKKMLSS